MYPQAKYKSDFHPEELLKLRKQGKAKAQIQAAFDISKPTYYDWIKKYPEFKAADELGNAYAQDWWCEFIKNNLLERNINERLVEFYFKILFPEHKDKRPIFIKGLKAAQSLDEKLNIIFQALENEGYNCDELNAIQNLIGKVTEMTDCIEIKNNLEKINASLQKPTS